METLLLGVTLFASTNIDDVFVLVALLAAGKPPARSVVLGQVLGILGLFGAVVLLSLGAVVIPEGGLRFLGLLPVGIGLRRLFRRPTTAGTEPAPSAASGVLAVVNVTVANGGDNLAIYAPVFATRSRADLVAFAAIFVAMTLVWCGAALALVHHPAWGTPVRRHGPRILPWVLIGLGTWILWG